MKTKGNFRATAILVRNPEQYSFRCRVSPPCLMLAQVRFSEPAPSNSPMKTTHTTDTLHAVLNTVLCPFNRLLWLCMVFGLVSTACAQTLVSGNISGTWTPAGNPYIAVDNCTVPSGQTLTIQPGVVFWIGENRSVTVNGSIQAVGTPSQRITIQAPVASQYWSNIVLNYSGRTNRFKYCDFQNGNRALFLRVYAVSETMYAEIMNCTFSNCPNAAIYGESEGEAYNSFGTIYELNPVLSPQIKNCVFADCGDGCRFYIFGHHFIGGGIEVFVGFGKAAPRMIGNIFSRLSGEALDLVTGPDSTTSTVDFVNNTVVNCRGGISATTRWDAKVQSSIFVGCSNAITRQGSLSTMISYNDFYGNATNFTGYPSPYGQFILQNRNSNSCDILFNISQDPLFVASNDFHLATNSPCIDAGTPDTAFSDCCFPPSLRTQFADLGAYGGPDACNWLDIVPKLPVLASVSKSNNVIRLNWDAIPRSEYQVQYVTNFLGTNNGTIFVMTNPWINFTNGRVLATEKPASLSVATNTSQNKVFFRIQSLGRTPGN